MSCVLPSALATVLASFAVAIPALAQVGLSVQLGQSGYYGPLELNGYPTPSLLYPRPVIIQPQSTGYSPVYMNVPPSQASNWGRYCAQYGVCNRPVYFVRDSWYTNTYIPYYRKHHPSSQFHGEQGRPGNSGNAPGHNK